MKNSQLNRVLSLVRHTGDRMIVMDPETDDVVVMMRLPEYENLLGVRETDPTLAENLAETVPWESWNADDKDEKDNEDEDMEFDFGEDEKSGPRPAYNHNDEYFPTNHNGRRYEADPYFNGESQFAFSRPVSKKKISASKSAPEDSLNFDDYDWNREEGLSFNEEDLRDIPEEEEEEKFYLEPVE